MQQRLHPNLARIAVEYDDARNRCIQRRISEAQFRREAEALVARDDEGVQWTIDPQTGQWMYLDRRGERVPGTPPTAGVVTPSAYDLTRDRSTANPDSQLMVEAVDLRSSDPVQGLRGITYQQSAPRPEPRVLEQAVTAVRSDSRLRLLLALVVLLGVALALFLVLGGDDPAPPAPVPAPSASLSGPTTAPSG